MAVPQLHYRYKSVSRQLSGNVNLTIRVFKAIFYTVLSNLYASGLIKISVLHFYRRIFANRFIRVVNLIFDVFFVIWMLVFTLAFIFRCAPTIDQYPTTLQPNIHCGDPSTLAELYVITDLITDIAMLALPVPFIARMKLSRREKLTVVSVLVFAGL